MRKLFFPLLFSLTSSVYSQSFTFKRLNIIEDKKNPIGTIPLNNGYCGIESSAKSRFGWTANLEKMKSSCKLLSFDNNMNFTKENMLSGGDEIYGPFSSFLKRINQKPYLIYYNYNNKNKAIEIYSASIDSINLTLSDNKKILSIDQKNVGLFKMVDLYYSYKLKIESSSDGQRTLFFWCPGKQNSFAWSVVDNNMNVIKTKNDVIDAATDIILGNTYVDNDGNFFAGFTYKKKDYFHSGLLAVDKNGNSKNTEVNFDKGSASYCFVTQGNTDNQVRIAGVYSEDHYYITGSFTCLIDKKSLLLSNPVLNPFAEKLVEKFDDDGYAKSKKNKFGLFPEIDFELITLSDGTLVMAGDITRYQTTGYGVNMSESPVKGSSLVITVKNDILSNSRLPKKEAYGQTGESNFYLHKYGDKAILFYADLESNLETPLENSKCTSYSNRKDNVLVAAVMENDGRIIRKILNPATNGKFSFYPGSMDRIDESSILFHLDKDKVSLMNIKTTYAFYILNISE